MVDLAARDVVTVAGLDPHNTPRTVLNKTLAKLGLVVQPAHEPAPSYASFGYDRDACKLEALALKKQRRADPITAKIDQLHSAVNAAHHLDAAVRDALKSDIRSVYQHDFGRYQEENTCKWFQKAAANSSFFPGSNKQLAFTKNHATGSKSRQ